MREIFPSTMDSVTRNWTVLILALFTFVTLAPLSTGQPRIGQLMGLALVAFAVIMYALSIRAVSVTADQMVVVRRSGFGYFALADIKSVAVVDEGELSGALRLFANGGLFGWIGIFFHPSVGRFYMNAIRTDRRVMLQFKNGNRLVLSADDPAGLVSAIERRRRMPRAE